MIIVIFPVFTCAAQSQRLQNILSNIPIQSLASLGAMRLRPLWSHELIIQYQKLYLSTWSVFWNVGESSNTGWKYCICETGNWFYGHTVMQMRWNYSEFQTKLRLVVYFCPAKNNQILKHHILQLYCMCLERKFLDLLVFVLTY